MKTIELDMRGQICPSCMLTALQHINNMETELKQSEIVLGILTDNRQSTSTIPDAVTKMGYKVDVTDHDEGYYLRVYYPNREQSEL